MHEWIAQNLVQLVIVFVAVVSAYFALNSIVKELRTLVDITIERLNKLENTFELHKVEEKPHTVCSEHHINLDGIKTTLNKKMDREPCEKIHESIDLRLNIMCEDIKDLKSALTPLSGIQHTLNKIETIIVNSSNGISSNSSSKR
jgi:hypothetical protein